MIVDEVAGRMVVVGARSETDNPAVPPRTEMEFTWSQIGDHLVVSEVRIWGVQGEQRSLVSQFRFDDIAIDAGFGEPPAPGALGLIGLGVLALGWMTRRRALG